MSTLRRRVRTCPTTLLATIRCPVSSSAFRSNPRASRRFSRCLEYGDGRNGGWHSGSVGGFYNDRVRVAKCGAMLGAARLMGDIQP